MLPPSFILQLNILVCYAPALADKEWAAMKWRALLRWARGYDSDEMVRFAPVPAGMAVINLAEYSISILCIVYFTDSIRGKNWQHFFKAIDKLLRLLQFGKRIPEHIAFSG